MPKIVLCFSLAFLLMCKVSSHVIPMKGGFQLHVVHLNDFHARFEETNESGGVCKDKCFGGFSRIYAAIHDIKKENPDAIVLNAGDNFQGTLWYNMFKWEVTQHFLNKLPTDVYTLGNHEFDDKIEGVVPFLDALNAPTVVANIDDSEEPEIQGKYKKSTVIKRGGKRIGIIGLVTTSTNERSNSEKLIFLDEAESMNKEAERLVSQENVDTIIVISHCGYKVEIEFAKKAHPKIGLIVGGHSHTFLFTGNDVPGSDDPLGPYPTVVKHSDGRQILVVQAGALSKYLGNIVVTYDGNGDVVSWEGAPIHLDETIKQDKEINKEIAVWKEEVDKLGKEVLGSSKVHLDYKFCKRNECNIGNFIADAMVHAYIDTDEENAWTSAAIAITNAGSIRAGIAKGDITYMDVIATHPFENTFDIGEIQGKYIKEFLEFSAISYSTFGTRERFNRNLLQFSGIRTVLNLQKPEWSRVESVKIRCRECTVPVYEPLDMEKMYKIVVVSFLSIKGGDGFTVISDNLKNRKVGPRDVDALREYIKLKSPIITSTDGRLEIIE